MKPLYGSFDYLKQKECIQVGEIIDPETFCHFSNNSTFQRDDIFQIDYVAAIIGDVGLYDTIAKMNKYAPWRYMGQCEKGHIENKNPALMPFVYVCSRYRAKTSDERLQNIELAKYACERVIQMGAIPIAPHLYFTRFLDDNVEFERDFGMEAGKKMMEMCSSFFVLTVDEEISEGMDEEIKYMTEILGLEGSNKNHTKEEAKRIVEQRLEI